MSYSSSDSVFIEVFTNELPGYDIPLASLDKVKLALDKCDKKLMDYMFNHDSDSITQDWIDNQAIGFLNWFSSYFPQASSAGIFSRFIESDIIQCALCANNKNEIATYQESDSFDAMDDIINQKSNVISQLIDSFSNGTGNFRLYSFDLSLLMSEEYENPSLLTARFVPPLGIDLAIDATALSSFLSVEMDIARLLTDNGIMCIVQNLHDDEEKTENSTLKISFLLFFNGTYIEIPPTPRLINIISKQWKGEQSLETERETSIENASQISCDFDAIANTISFMMNEISYMVKDDLLFCDELAPNAVFGGMPTIAFYDEDITDGMINGSSEDCETLIKPLPEVFDALMSISPYISGDEASNKIIALALSRAAMEFAENGNCSKTLDEIDDFVMFMELDESQRPFDMSTLSIFNDAAKTRENLKIDKMVDEIYQSMDPQRKSEIDNLINSISIQLDTQKDILIINHDVLKDLDTPTSLMSHEDLTTTSIHISSNPANSFTNLKKRQEKQLAIIKKLCLQSIVHPTMTMIMASTNDNDNYEYQFKNKKIKTSGVIWKNGHWKNIPKEDMLRLFSWTNIDSILRLKPNRIQYVSLSHETEAPDI